MQDAANVELIRRKFSVLVNDLDERARRRWAAVEAKALGRGGISVVSRATGMSRGTVRAGLRELVDPQPLPSTCQRHSGGGRKPHHVTQPGLRNALDQLIEPATRGSPINPLRWTCKSTRRLAKELRRQGFAVSASSVRRLLRQTGRRIGRPEKENNIRIGTANSSTFTAGSWLKCGGGRRRFRWTPRRRKCWET